MKLTVEINLDNAAFEDNPHEVRDILKRVADEYERGNGCNTLRDSNGNLVGSWEAE